MKKSLVYSSLVLILATTGAFADDAAAPMNADTMKTDQHVLSKIHHGNHMEIEMSKLAAGRSTTNGVKEYAEHIIQDHGTADIEVKMTAKKESIKLQDMPTPETDDEKQAMKADHAEMAKLKSLKGADFDAEYKSVMIEDHKKTIAELNSVLPKLGQPTHDLVEKLIPEFQKHLDAVEKLNNT